MVIPQNKAEAGGLRSDEVNSRVLAVRRWADVRDLAKRQVRWPSMLLLFGGAFLTLFGLVLLVGTVVALYRGTFWPEPSSRHILLDFVWGIGVLAGVIVGPVIIVAAYRMEKLRSYGLALTGTVLLCVFGLVTCAPLALLGIWPLFALFNSDVRWAFTNSELPDETLQSTSTT